MATTGHEHERVEVQGLKASMKKGGNIGIYNDCICSTAAATAAKVTNTVPPSFSLTAKAKILVKFTYGINVANATLQVGENAAKPIYYQGAALDAGRVKAGMFVLLQYDGTNFNIVGDIAKMDAYYKNLHAGLADNLFGETQTNDVFTFRPTAGIQDIESGDAPVGGGTIKKVEGNGVSWNQYCRDGEITISASETGRMGASFGVTIPRDHKIFVSAFVKKSTDFTSTNMALDLSDGGDTWGGSISYAGTAQDDSYHRICGIVVNNNSANKNLYYKADYHSQGTASFKNVNVIDLTLIYGAGNEPTTPEEVEAWLANNVGLKEYYPYNEGELIPVKDFKVKSVGFNALSNGTAKVLKGDEYEIVGTYTAITLDGDTITPSSGKFTPSKNGTLTVTGYDNTTCVHLVYDGDRDGEYEEYWEREVTLDPTKLYGKLNGTGESVQVFPDGMKKAGTAYDEIVKVGNVTKAIKRVGKVDFGTLTWTYSDERFLSENIASLKALDDSVVFRYITGDFVSCARYVNGESFGTYDTFKNGEISQYIRAFVIKDNRYSDAASFTAAMSGVVAYYVLRNVEEYILDEDILPVQYRVDNYGTEEVLLGNDDSLVSSSPKMTISYGINAADTIADLPHSYVSVLPQQLDEDKQKQARQNINAASQYDMIVVKKQLELIDKKVENDYYVDMGLPSGLLWAKRNLDVTQPDGFAASPFQYECSFFSWGNVDGHNPISASAFDYDFGTSNDGVYASTPGATIQYPSSAGLSFDIARKTLGAPWRLPSTDDFKELIDNCKFVQADGETEIDVSQTNKLVTVNSIMGIYLKSKINGNLLFFPCSGVGISTSWNDRGACSYYWSSSLYSASLGWYLYFYSGGVYPQGNSYRFYGFTGRPVM